MTTLQHLDAARLLAEVHRLREMRSAMAAVIDRLAAALVAVSTSAGKETGAR